MEKLHEVLKTESAGQIETLHYLLSGVMEKYGVRINLNDIAGISKMDSQMGLEFTGSRAAKYIYASPNACFRCKLRCGS